MSKKRGHWPTELGIHRRGTGKSEQPPEVDNAAKTFARLARRDAHVSFEELSLLFGKVHALEEYAAGLEGKLSAVRKSRRDAQSRYGRAVNRIKELESKIDGLNARINELSGENGALQKHVREIEDAIENAERRYKEDIGVDIDVDRLRRLERNLRWIVGKHIPEITIDDDIPVGFLSDTLYDRGLAGFDQQFFPESARSHDDSRKASSRRQARTRLGAREVHALLSLVQNHLHEAITNRRVAKLGFDERSEAKMDGTVSEIAALLGLPRWQVENAMRSLVTRSFSEGKLPRKEDA